MNKNTSVRISVLQSFPMQHAVLVPKWLIAKIFLFLSYLNDFFFSKKTCRTKIILWLNCWQLLTIFNQWHAVTSRHYFTSWTRQPSKKKGVWTAGLDYVDWENCNVEKQSRRLHKIQTHLCWPWFDLLFFSVTQTEMYIAEAKNHPL